MFIVSFGLGSSALNVLVSRGPSWLAGSTHDLEDGFTVDRFNKGIEKSSINIRE